jgi:hypothetical protein
MSTGACSGQPVRPASKNTGAPAAPSVPAASQGVAATPQAEMETMEVAKAVMVTVELELGTPIPSIAEALSQVERRYLPDDGRGRTFAILDAYGEPTPDGKLHMSMHVSAEKSGLAQLVHRPTGRILWTSRILPAPPAGPKNLGIYLDDGKGNSRVLDGSKNPASVFDAFLQGTSTRVGDVWPDGVERELTFIYSACGCPVKVKARRQGDRTVRSSDLPVMFPDDPEVNVVINRLMRW